MSDKIKFKMEIDTKQSNKDLDVILGKLKSINASTKGYASTFNASSKKMDAGRKAHLNYLKHLQKEHKKLQREQKKTANGGMFSKFKVGVMLGNLYANAIGNITSAFTSLIPQMIEATKQYGAMEFSLKAVTEGEEDYQKAIEFTRGLVALYGGNLMSITKQYTKFRAATKSSNMSLSDTNKIYENIHKSAAILHLDNQALERSFKALEQMISKGKVSSEELRQQLGDSLPGAYSILAESMGVTTLELDKQLKSGQVMAEDVLPKFSEELLKAYGGENLTSISTFSTESQKLATAWKDLLNTLSDEGSMKKATKAMRGLIIAMNNASDSKWWNRIKGAAYFIPGIGVTVAQVKATDEYFEGIAENQDELDKKKKKRNDEDTISDDKRLKKLREFMGKLSTEKGTSFLSNFISSDRFSKESDYFQQETRKMLDIISQTFEESDVELDIIPSDEDIVRLFDTWAKEQEKARKEAKALDKEMSAFALTIPEEGEEAEELAKTELQKKMELYGLDFDTYKTYEERKTAVAKHEYDNRVKMIDTYAGVLNNMSDMMMDLAEMADADSREGFERQKRLQKSGILMNTASGIMNIWGDWKSGMSYWGRIAATAGLAVTGGKQWAEVNKLTYDGDSGSSSSSSSLPSISNVAPVASGVNIANVERTQKPQEAYVVLSSLQAAELQQKFIIDGNSI